MKILRHRVKRRVAWFRKWLAFKIMPPEYAGVIRAQEELLSVLTYKYGPGWLFKHIT